MPLITKTDDNGARRLAKENTDVDILTNASTQLNEDVKNIKAGTLGLTGYDIIVGSAADVVNELATHVVGDFVAAISNDDRVYFRSGTHVLARDETITETGVKFYFDPGAVIDDGASQTLTFLGDRAQVYDGRFTGFAADAIILAATGCYFIVTVGDLSIFLLDSASDGSMVVSVNSGIKTAQWDIDTITGDITTIGHIISTAIGLDQCSVMLDGTDPSDFPRLNITDAPTYTALSVGFPTDDYTEIVITGFTFTVDAFGSDRRGEMIWLVNGTEFPRDQYVELNASGDLVCRVLGDWTSTAVLFEGRRR